MHLLRDRKLPLSFLILSILMISIGTYVYRLSVQQKRKGEWVVHTHAVLNQLESLSAHLTEAETAQRGYLLTGQAVYLTPYFGALLQIDNDVIQFHQLTKDNPIQQAHMVRLSQHINDKLADFKTSIVLKKSQNASAGNIVVLSEKGRKQMEAIHVQIDRMLSEEYLLLNQRKVQWQSASVKIQRIIMIGGILSFILWAVVYAYFTKKDKHSKQLEVAEQPAIHFQNIQSELVPAVEMTEVKELVHSDVSELELGDIEANSTRIVTFAKSDSPTKKLKAEILSGLPGYNSAMETLRANVESLEEAQQMARMGSSEFDLATKKRTWSKEMFLMLGVSPEEGEPDYATKLDFFTPEDAIVLDVCLQRAELEGIGYEVDVQKAIVEGDIPQWYHAVGKPVFDSQGKVSGLVGTLTDISESKRLHAETQTENKSLTDSNTLLEEEKSELQTANTRLYAQATTDGLTGLKNHLTYQERLTEEYQRAMRYNTPLSIMMLDIDNFKQFNDTFGHPAGDEVLRSVAAILQFEGRTTDLVARYGGEEFVLMLPETDAHGAIRIAERIRSAIANAVWDLRGITISAGTATLDIFTVNADHLVNAADKALYQSKTQGRNRVTHSGSVPVVLNAIEAAA